ncbi:MAG TPA: HAMP domain-containing sensor histidine kinase [Terriglobia bacterium]|nr:HAMP domain-containing sensor histidine kinase [Terriglobia bacterium]
MDSRQHGLLREVIRQQFENPKQYDSRIDEIYASSAQQTSDVLELADGRVIERFSKAQSLEGRTVGRVWSFRDISERRLTEEALKQADRRKDEFLSVLAHELRNPLAAVLMAAKLLQAKGPPDPLLQNFREIIVRQTMVLSKLVDDLLDVGGITTGKLRLEKKRVELNTILKEAAEVCTPLIQRRNHILKVHFADPPVWLNVDAGRIVQVVGNLLNNAAKYMNDGGQIELLASEERGSAVIRVRDKGVGIPREMLSRIFQRFVQIGVSKHGADGLGIGLSLVKALVERHGGTVEAASEGLGKGSEFTVRLPL